MLSGKNLDDNQIGTNGGLLDWNILSPFPEKEVGIGLGATQNLPHHL